jgi:hypothetical protein
MVRESEEDFSLPVVFSFETCEGFTLILCSILEPTPSNLRIRKLKTTNRLQRGADFAGQKHVVKHLMDF